MNSSNTSDDKTLEQKLIKVIARHSPFPHRPITLDSTIQTDLGIEGDDGYALIDDIGKEFDVDFGNFDDRYFWDELFMSLGVLLFLFTPLAWFVMKVTRRGRKVDIKVQDLLHAIIRGHWEHPDRAAKYPWERKRNLSFPKSFQSN